MTKKNNNKPPPPSEHDSSTQTQPDEGALEAAQLRAATAGGCCWSVDCSCRPRYSLWGRTSSETTLKQLDMQTGTLMAPKGYPTVKNDGDDDDDVNHLNICNDHTEKV